MSLKRQEIAKMTECLVREKTTKFTNDEIMRLINEFREISKGSTRLSRSEFREFLNAYFSMTDDVLMDRVFRVFDMDCDNFVTCEEWIRGMYVFLNGSFDEKAKFAFGVYDLNGDGYITREEMFQLLKGCLTKQTTEDDQDESVKDIVEILLKKADIDHDGRLNFDDFIQTLRAENLLIECLGGCLPKSRDKESFIMRLNLNCGNDNQQQMQQQKQQQRDVKSRKH